LTLRPTSPRWLLHPYPRRLELPFRRTGKESERVVTFDSGPFLVELDDTPLPKGVTCTCFDAATQQYTFHLDKGRARSIAFKVSPTKDENISGLLKASVKAEDGNDTLSQRITVYALHSYWDPNLISLAINVLKEIPNRWRALVVAALLGLLTIAPPWLWDNPQGLLAVLPFSHDITDLSQHPLHESFQSGLRNWSTSSKCPTVQSTVDTVPRSAYLPVTQGCLALAKTASSVEGFHPLSSDPVLKAFWAQIEIQFEPASKATILLHAGRVWPFLRPFTANPDWGDRLSIERMGPKYSVLKVSMNCSPSPCPKQEFTLTPADTDDAIATITVRTWSLKGSEGSYFVDVTPNTAPEGFGNPLAFDGSHSVGALGFIGTDQQPYNLDEVTLLYTEPGPTNRP
jgi:hypothetical protein